MKIKTPSQINSLEKLNWIRLARTENIGPATFFRLLEIFGTASVAVEKTPEFSAQNGLRRPLSIASAKEVENEIAQAKIFDSEIITFGENDYPRLLREIYDPAPILTVRGNKEFLNKDSIAIVGPRNATFHACKFSEKMALDLGDNEITVVSGLAKGVDAAAHRGALKTGTVAVIAGGINNVYPAENAELYRQIFKSGVLVSEQPFGAAPRGANFIQRNRIISGMSYGVVVVEAGVQSGSLATARFALDQGREVFAVPGFPMDPRNSGSNLLLEDGATFTQNAAKIMKEMPGMRARLSEAGMLHEPDSTEFEAPIAKFQSDDDIKKVRDEIFTKIGFIPMQTEEIISELQVPARLVNIALVQLELADKIAINFGRVVKK